MIEAYLESIREVVRRLEYYYTRKEWMMCCVLSWRRFCGLKELYVLRAKDLSESLRSVSTPAFARTAFSLFRHHHTSEPTSYFSGFPPSNDIKISSFTHTKLIRHSHTNFFSVSISQITKIDIQDQATSKSGVYALRPEAQC